MGLSILVVSYLAVWIFLLFLFWGLAQLDDCDQDTQVGTSAIWFLYSYCTDHNLSNLDEMSFPNFQWQQLKYLLEPSSCSWLYAGSLLRFTLAIKCNTYFEKSRNTFSSPQCVVSCWNFWISLPFIETFKRYELLGYSAHTLVFMNLSI